MRSFWRFVTRCIAVAAIPVAALVTLYVCDDPFRVVRSYDTYYCAADTLRPDINKGVISVAHFEQHYPAMQYDSYIIGSSLSINYRIADWQAHIGPDARCYHFDTAAATPRTLRLIVEYLDRQGAELRDVLLVLPARNFDEAAAKGTPYILPPALDPAMPAWRFQWAFAQRAMDREFLRAYLGSRLVGHRLEPVNEAIITRQQLIDHPLTNEERNPRAEQQLASDPAGWHRALPPDSERAAAATPYTEADMQHFSRIAELLRAHGTRLRVIISPDRCGTRPQAADLRRLRQIFGAGTVVDASGIATDADRDFFDGIHYTRGVATRIMDAAYTPSVYPSE